jgi:transposase InsO family protein
MIMIVVDKFTSGCHFVPRRSPGAAPDTAKRFLDSIVRIHGIPAVMVSDRGAKFTSAVWRAFHRFGKKLALSTAYHSQTDSQSERMVRTVKEMLIFDINHKQNDWENISPL